MGVKEDYFIVQGISGKDELNEKTTLYIWIFKSVKKILPKSYFF